MTGINKSLHLEIKAKHYFDRPGFRRMLTLVWGKYAALGKAGGTVTIKLANENECEVINDFFGKYYRPLEPIQVRLEEFQQELLASAFPYTIPELHQILEGKPLLTKLEKSIIRQEQWKQLFTSVKAGTNERNHFIITWLQRLEAGAALGYRTLLEQFEISPVQAGIFLQHTVKSLDFLFNQEIPDSSNMSAGPLRLPYLAVIATGDSHALDMKRPAGRLLYYALRERKSSGTENNHSYLIEEEHRIEEEYVADTLSIREVYRSAGIADDDLSAIVHLFIPEPKGLSIPTVWTLRQIEAMATVPIISALYVVENPTVFSMLLDATNKLSFGDNQASILSRPPPMLVCNSGPASAAALRLFQRMNDASAEPFPMYYSGDYDVKGLEMGIVLANRFPKQFLPWKFDSVTFLDPLLHCPNGPEFSQLELNRMLQLSIPWDNELTQAMHKNGHKVFQEMLIPTLARNWLEALG
jgi:uncharacterized protein (TIGR02679 family)